jgi:hypothetical protein
MMKNHPNDCARWSRQALTLCWYSLLRSLIFGPLFFSLSCGHSEAQRDDLASASAPATAPAAQEARPPEPPSYDLGTIDTYQQAIDQDGRTVEETYSMPDGKTIKIRYEWEGGSNRCRKATARLDGQILAVATAVAVRTDVANGPLQEVEEVHYSVDTPQEITYKAKSLFDISLTAGKTDELPVHGKKHNELFTHWGTFRSMGTRF